MLNVDGEATICFGYTTEGSKGCPNQNCARLHIDLGKPEWSSRPKEDFADIQAWLALPAVSDKLGAATALANL